MDMCLFKFPADMQHSFLSDVVDDAVDYTPANEVELCNRRRKSLKLNPFRTTKRVEKLFRIAIQ
jgi:hypothetical protein